MMASAIVYVQHLNRMATFYAECFNLQSTAATGDYCVLESNAWNLSLVMVPDAVAAAGGLADPPLRRAGTPIKLAFAVANIEGQRAVIGRLGGRLEPPGTTWEFAGFLRCDALDPEGNVVQLLQATSG